MWRTCRRCSWWRRNKAQHRRVRSDERRVASVNSRCPLLPHTPRSGPPPSQLYHSLHPPHRTMSSESELTDVSDDEDVSYNAPSKSKTKGKGKGSASDGGYRIRGALRPPRATTYTCQSLYGAHICCRNVSIFSQRREQTRSTPKTSTCSPSTSAVGYLRRECGL